MIKLESGVLQYIVVYDEYGNIIGRGYAVWTSSGPQYPTITDRNGKELPPGRYSVQHTDVNIIIVNCTGIQ